MRSRPASAGFIGCFRAAPRAGSRSGPISRRPFSASEISNRDAASTASDVTFNPLAATFSQPEVMKPPQRLSKLGRPISAPLLLSGPSRCDEERLKRSSEWDMLGRYQTRLKQQADAEVTQQKALNTEEEHHLLSAEHSRQAKQRVAARRRREFDLKNMNGISREFRLQQMEEKRLAKEKAAEAQAVMKDQMLQSRQRRQQEKERQLREEEMARQECVRLVSIEKAEKAAAAEVQRQERLEVSKNLLEQSRLKRIAVREEQAKEKQLVREYQELMDRQEAARAAVLQARADDQARRMAQNQGVQEIQKAKDDAMAERIERHWKEKYAADDAKSKRESFEREQRLQDCNIQRHKQIVHDEELLRFRHAEDQQHMSKLFAQHKAAVARDQAMADLQQAKRKENQAALLAQIAETRARVPVDMSQSERDLNAKLLVEAAGTVTSALW